MDRKEIAAVLASAGLRPQHHFGQNFMIDGNVLRAILAAGGEEGRTEGIGPRDVILEVGPGAGNLTRLLAQAVPQGAVLAVDIDRKLLPAAQRHHAELTNVTWLLADVLAGKHAIEPRVIAALHELQAAHPGGALRLVSNLPYNAASPLIAELLVEMWRQRQADSSASQHNPQALFFSRMAFTVQWEVAQRMAAGPGTRDYGPLGILIQSLAEVEIVRKIPPGVFWPPPKIHSALVVVTPDRAKLARMDNAPRFQALLAGIFSHRRQTLGNALKHYLADHWTPELKQSLAQTFDLSLRPESFTVEQLLSLSAEFTL